MVAVAVERRVYPCCRAEQRQAVSIRNQAAAWWPEREVGSTRQGDAERLPVEATIQESEIGGVDIDEHAAGVEHGQVERQALDVLCGQSQLVGGADCSLLDTRSTIYIANLRSKHDRFVHRNGCDQGH